MSLYKRYLQLFSNERSASQRILKDAANIELHSGTAGTLAVPNVSTLERKKGLAASRKWMRVDSDGSTYIVQPDRYTLMNKLGVQLRDLRVLDPQLATSYPSAILCRDRALVVNLEYIKCIITTEYVLVLNPDNEQVSEFLHELIKRLTGLSSPMTPGVAVAQSMPALPTVGSAAELPRPSTPASRESNDTPFELRTLECVLDTVCVYLERLTSDLEAHAHPALDALTAKVTSSNLERVRRIKNRMVRLTTKVETIREVLEKLLDDDADMRDMNLTYKIEQDELAKAATLEQQHGGELRRVLTIQTTPRNVHSFDADDLFGEAQDAVESVEMLLETYFMQIDNTYNKLQTLCEYIDDTEDYINIELDNHRNQLIQLELLLTAAAFAVSIIAAVSGLFGMNLNNYPTEGVDSYPRFVIVSLSTSVGAVVVFVAIVVWCRYKQIIT